MNQRSDFIHWMHWPTPSSMNSEMNISQCLVDLLLLNIVDNHHQFLPPQNPNALHHPSSRLQLDPQHPQHRIGKRPSTLRLLYPRFSSKKLELMAGAMQSPRTTPRTPATVSSHQTTSSCCEQSAKPLQKINTPAHASSRTKS